MLKNIVTVVCMAGVATMMLYSLIFDREATDVPDSIASMNCLDIAQQFIGEEFEVNYTLRMIKRVDMLEELKRDSLNLTCRGLAFIEGSPSTYVRLEAVDNLTRVYSLNVTQAKPEDYTCELLAREMTMKFSRDPIGDFGTITEIRQPVKSGTGPGLHCRGVIEFSNGDTFPMPYSYDGNHFTVNQ
jgi:hypothetical protein